MINDNNPYEYYNEKLCVQLRFLYKDIHMHPESIRVMNCRALRKRIASTSFPEKQLRLGSLGVHALIAWDSINQDWRSQLVKKFGPPPVFIRESWFKQNYQFDNRAWNFYNTYGYEAGQTPLSEELKDRYAKQASVFNTTTRIIQYRKSKAKSLNSLPDDLWGSLLADIMSLEIDHGFVFSSKDSLRKKHAGYVKALANDPAEGYAYLISGKINNTNRVAIKGSVADWLLAQYCLPIKMSVPALMRMYDAVREERGWKKVKERAVNAWLETPEIKRIWVLARHGKEEYNKIYSHRINRDRSNWFPNAYWAIDGSKLDWIHYYDNDLGMAAKLKINPLLDVYSEKVLGWSYSETENHTDHFTAIKMAVNNCQTRPYLINYDNQSGHTSARMQEMYSNLVAKDGGTHYPTRPHEKSSPAEHLLSRFQQEVINQMWFSDKQSIKSREMDSRPNMDFIKEFKHKLYTKDFLLKAWELCVKQWNQSRHPKFKDQTRNQVYKHEMLMSEPIDICDMIGLFWIDETKGSIYRREGISIDVGRETYTFEVYDKDNRIDTEFRRKYVGSKLIVRYDPEQLDQYVQLLEVTPTGDKIHVANAQPKRGHESIPALMKDGAKEMWHQDFKVRDIEYERDLSAYEALVRRTGISRRQLIEDQDLMIKMGGDLPKTQRTELESNLSLSRL